MRSGFNSVLRDWGQSATIGGVAGIQVVFDEAAAEAENMEGLSPQIQCREADLPAGTDQGTVVQVNGATYSITEMNPDGRGWIQIPLQRTSS